MDDLNLKIMVLLNELLKGEPFVVVTKKGLIGNVVPEEVSKMLAKLEAEADDMIAVAKIAPYGVVRH